MISKEKTGNIYYITDVDRTPGYVDAVKNLNITNVCIICGNNTGNTTSMVCDECKDAIDFSKKFKKYIKETLNERKCNN